MVEKRNEVDNLNAGEMIEKALKSPNPEGVLMDMAASVKYSQGVINNFGLYKDQPYAETVLMKAAEVITRPLVYILTYTKIGLMLKK